MTDPRLWRRALLSGCAAAAFIASQAQAQDTPGADTQDVQDIEEVVVTGTRIRRDPLSAPAPIFSLGENYIDRTGLSNIGDVLQRTPFSGSALNSKFNNSGNFGFPTDGSGVGAGASNIDLRNLGAVRTLVLVDGQRWVPGSSASGISGAVDLNTIPEEAIERIEILQDGASAIYGSDAIGGVVNIITKKNFEGLTARAQFGGFIDEGDGEIYDFRAAYGVQGDDTRVFFSASFIEQNAVDASARPISTEPGPFEGSTACCGSSRVPQGRFIFSDPVSGFDFDLNLAAGAANERGDLATFSRNDPGTTDDFGDFVATGSDPDLFPFNFAQFNLLQVPLERTNIYGFAEHDLTDDIQLYLRAMYNNRKSTNRAAPEPIDINAGSTSAFLSRLVIPADHPFNPFGIDLDPQDPDIASDIRRRPLEVGPRIFDQNVDTWLISGGFQGEFRVASRDIFWDINGIYAENRADQLKFNAINARALAQALGDVDDCVIIDANNDNIDDGTGCTPFNIFGGQGPDGTGSITPAMVDFITFIQKDTSRQTLKDFTANISSTLFNLPAGPIGIAAGVEHRDQSGFFIPDSIVAAGESNGIPAQPFSGGFDVTELYGETIIPILEGVPLADRLEVQAAGRYSDYSLFSGEATFKVGALWRPFADLVFRGAYSTGLRAPTIGELNSASARSDLELADPCSDFLAQNPNDPFGRDAPLSADQIANCVSNGVPADGDFIQLDPQISATVGGNPDLEPEESDNLVVSAAYSPSWIGRSGLLEQLTLEINYYKIEIEDTIAPNDAQTILDSCALNGELCGLINRAFDGTIITIDNTLDNLGQRETEGIDLSIDGTTPETDFGVFSLRWTNNFLLDFTEFLPGAGNVSREGRLFGGTLLDAAFPEWRSTVALDWSMSRWSASAIVRHVSPLTETCPSIVAGPFPEQCSDLAALENEIAAETYLDLQVSYVLPVADDQVAITIGANNVFDNNPDGCVSCALNGFAQTVHDVPGVLAYFRLSFRS